MASVPYSPPMSQLAQSGQTLRVDAAMRQRADWLDSRVMTPDLLMDFVLRQPHCTPSPDKTGLIGAVLPMHQPYAKESRDVASFEL